MVLADHVVVEEGLDLGGSGQRDLGLALFPVVLLGDDVVAELDALVADVDRRPGDELPDLALGLAAERAGEVDRVLLLTPGTSQGDLGLDVASDDSTTDPGGPPPLTLPRKPGLLSDSRPGSPGQVRPPARRPEEDWSSPLAAGALDRQGLDVGRQRIGSGPNRRRNAAAGVELLGQPARAPGQLAQALLGGRGLRRGPGKAIEHSPPHRRHRPLESQIESRMLRYSSASSVPRSSASASTSTTSKAGAGRAWPGWDASQSRSWRWRKVQERVSFSAVSFRMWISLAQYPRSSETPTPSTALRRERG